MVDEYLKLEIYRPDFLSCPHCNHEHSLYLQNFEPWKQEIKSHRYCCEGCNMFFFFDFSVQVTTYKRISRTPIGKQDGDNAGS